MSGDEIAGSIPDHPPDHVVDYDQVRDWLSDRYTRDTLSSRAVDAAARAISDDRDGGVGGSGVSIGEGIGGKVYDSDTGAWRDDSGQFTSPPEDDR